MSSRAVLITGCSSGIGHATASRLVTDGWTVYATARRREAIADLQDAGARTLSLDATKHAVEAISDALRFEVRGFGVDVILVEPGLIVTGFGDVASGSVSDATGPYADFNRHVATLTADAYHGPMAKLGGPPEVVADTIAKALTATRPRARYPVTPSAHLMIGQRRITPDRVWDLMMRAQFPTPGR